MSDIETESKPESATAPAKEKQAFRAWIAAPALIPPLVVGLLVLLGVPQSFTSTLSGADPFEPNDTFAESLPLPAGVTANMSCGAGDVDWFTVQIPAGKCLQLTTTPPANDRGATSVHSAAGVPLAQTAFGQERCVYAPPGLKGEAVHVRVWGQRGPTYSISVELLEPALRFEPNDEKEKAAPIKLGRHDTLACNGSDWFRVFQPASRVLSATVDSQTGVGVRLFSTTDAVAPVTTGLPSSAVAQHVGAGRPLLVHVFGQGKYSLDLAAGPSVQASTQGRPAPMPAFAESLEPNDTREDAAPIKPGRYGRLRCNGKDWYSIKVAKNSTLELSALFKRNRGDLQLKLEYPLAGRGAPGSRYGIHKDNGYALRHFAAEDCLLKILVSGSRIPYKLNVKVTPGLPGVAIAAGVYPFLLCKGTDEWRISLKKGDRLSIELSNDVSNGWLSLQVLDGAGSSRGSSSSSAGSTVTTYAASEDGPVFVRVSGAAIRYQLRVSIDRGEKAGVFSPPSAEKIGPGVYRDRVLAGDGAVHYAIRVGKLERLMVEASFANKKADIDLELVDEAGQKLSSSATSDDVEHLEHISTSPKTVYVRVYTYAAKQSTYELTVALGDRSRPLKGTVPELEPGLRAVDDPSGNDVFAVALKKGDRLRASIAHATTDGADLDLALLDGRGRESVRSTDGEGKESLQFTSPREQTVYLRVHGRKPLRFDLDLAVATRSE